METKLDILPSTKSKEICPVLTTDLNFITKEREEELLNDGITTCDEDIDEDEALSDDSLRLKLSDDEEVELDDVDSSEYFYKQLKEEESDKDKKYENRVATRSEEEKDSYRENFLLQENPDLKEETSSEVKSVENSNINQSQLTDDLNASEGISSTEIAHDQHIKDTIMNGNDPRFYPNSIRPMFENRWSPPNHRMRMGFNNRPPLPPHQRYYPNSNYNNADITDNRYYNNKYKHYNKRSPMNVRPTSNHYLSYNYKPKSGERKNDALSNVKEIDFKSDDIVETNVEEKPECEDSAEKRTEPSDSVAKDKKVDNTDGKVDEINSTERVIDSEKSDNEKENINDCITDSTESLTVKTAKSTEDDLSDSLKLDEETPVQSPLKSQVENMITDENTTENASNNTETNSTSSLRINDEGSQEESTTLVDNVIANDCSIGTSDNNDNLKELDKKISEETVQTDNTDLKLQCSNDDIENSKDMVIGEEDLAKKDNHNEGEEEEEKENSETSSESKQKVESSETEIPPLSNTICLNEDSGSTMDNLPKVYQCLEEIASMEASRIAEEMKRVEQIAQDDMVDSESIKLQLSQGCDNDDTDCENNTCDNNPPDTVSQGDDIHLVDNDKKSCGDNYKTDDTSVAPKSVQPVDEDTMPYDSVDTENEPLKETNKLLDNNDDKDDDMDEEEMSNLTIESSESVNSSSKNIVEDKDSGSQDVEKMNFDDNACHPNEDSKETSVNNTEVTKDNKYTNSLYDSLLVKKSDIIMEDISSDKLNDASNDVSNDISNDINYDISNDVSNDVNSNDANVDVQIKMIEEDESNSQNSVAIREKMDQDIELKDDEAREEIKDTVKDAKTGEVESNTNIEQIKEIIGVQDEKMITDDNQEPNDVPKTDKKMETSKTSDFDSSTEKLESTPTDVTMKDCSSSEKKKENYLRLKSQTDDTLFAPKTSPVEKKEGEPSVRQKRRTAKNAEELIKTKFLKSDSEVDSDDSGKYVSVNYKKTKLHVNVPSSVSPSSLKRNLGDDEDVDNETDSLERQISVKKLKMTIDSPKKMSNESLFSFKKDVKRDIKNIKDVADVKDVKDIKKIKDQESIRNLVNVRKFFQRDMKGKLKKLKQEELEELLIQKIVETITMASEIGKLREQARLSEKNQEATRARCQQLAKQIQDFEMVLKRNAADRSSSNDKFVAPIKINRSVGLQVNFISDQGMQNMRQIQQNAKSASISSSSSSTSSSSEVGTAHPRKGIKVRSPRRSENIPSVGPPPPLTNIPAQPQIPTPNIPNPVTPAALVSTKTISVEPATRTMPGPLQSINAQQPVISNVNIRSPNKLSMIQGLQQVQQAVILNGNLNTNRVPTTTPITVQKPKANNDLIDLTDEEEKTKTNVNTPIAVTTATIISNHPQSRGNIIQTNATSHYQRVIQAIPTSVSLSGGQTANIRVVQPNSQTTPTALVNNINASRMFVMQSGGQPRQILITNPNSIRQNTSSSNRNQFSTITYKNANGIPTTANGTLRLVTTQATVNAQITKHPAPLPDSTPSDNNPNWKLPPPAPSLKISKVASGIVLSWNMTLSDKHAEIVSYQLFAYQEVNGTPPSTLLWKKVGDVMALPLPMACTLTQFSAGNNYYFAVRAVDSHSRLGQYSLPGNISL